MPSTTLPCPWCEQKPQSHTYLGHIFSRHKEALLSYKDNRKRLEYFSTQRPQPIHFELPNKQANHCCLGCKTSCVKLISIEKHFPRHAKEHQQALLALLPDKLAEGKTEEFIDTDVVKARVNIARSLRQVKNNFIALKCETNTLQKKINRLLEAKKITEDDLSDISDAEEESYNIVEENEFLFKQTLPWLEQRHVDNPRLLEEPVSR